jgi:hypothetical protein
VSVAAESCGFDDGFVVDAVMTADELVLFERRLGADPYDCMPYVCIGIIDCCV